MSIHHFKSTITKTGKQAQVMLPFDPNDVWGAKERHHIHGTINGCTIRGPLSSDGEGYFVALGEAWRRDNRLEVGADVEVELSPEGPLAENVSPDIANALAAEAQAKTFFEGLPTFYRKNYIRWIESAKRPETRAARISEIVELLRSGKRER